MTESLFSQKYIHLSFILIMFMISGCGGRKLKESDPNYVPSRVRKEQRKQKRIVANYQAEFDKIKSRYAYEARMLRLLEAKNLPSKEQEKLFKKELKKIIMIKGSSALSPATFCAGGLNNNNGSFLYYKNSLESDMRMLQNKTNDFASYEWHHEYKDTLVQMQDFLVNLDRIFDIVYLDVEVVRDAQMVAMNSMINQLASDNRELEKQLRINKEKPVTVVINNAAAEDDGR